VGLSATVPGGGIRFDSDSNSNLIQTISNFDRFRKEFLELKKFGIKYGCEYLEERNNFLHRYFSRLVMEIELKIWELKV
jgi:hypothetical protein